MAQRFPCGLPLPSCSVQAWQLIGNSIPPPMAYLGLLGPAAAHQGWGLTGSGGNWAANGFRRCCRASDEAWEAGPGDMGPAQEGQRAVLPRSPPPATCRGPRRGDCPRHEIPQDEDSPGGHDQGQADEGRRVPTTIWMDPPSKEEERDLLVALHALRSGALDVNGLPSAAHRGALRVRGLDRPPRQSCLTPARSTPDSVDEPSPRARTRSRSPEGQGAWRPARAFAALAFTALAAQAQVAEATRPQEATGTGLMSEAGVPWSWGRPTGCPQADRPRADGWPCWRLVARHAWRDHDDTLGYPGEGPQMPHSTPSAKSETLTLVTANVTSRSTGTGAGVLASEAEVLILQEVRLREDSLRAAKSEAKRAKYHGTWAAAKRTGQCGPASGGLATLVCETKAFRAVSPDSPGPQWKEGRWTHTAIGAGGTHFHVINLYGWPQGTPDLWKN